MSADSVEELRKWINDANEVLHKEERVNQENFAEFEQFFNKTIATLKLVIQSEIDRLEGRKDSLDPTMALIKTIAGKIKSLIPERWWSGKSREWVDKILDNLSPETPEGYRRLQLYVNEFYEPALRKFIDNWRIQLTLEAYEKAASKILTNLVKSETNKMGGEAGVNINAMT